LRLQRSQRGARQCDDEKQDEEAESASVRRQIEPTGGISHLPLGGEGLGSKMACNAPIWGWPGVARTKNGKVRIVFDKAMAIPGSRSQPVKCGQCIGCRLDKTREWAARCHHEASLHETSSFVTLTYDDEQLPEDGSLNKEHFQGFMKRLRAKWVQKDPIKREYGQVEKIRYYMCGEYGPKTGRPHYHACLFGFGFDDLVLYKEAPEGNIYISEELNRRWGYGFATVGEVTYESAAYVAGYTIGKATGPREDEYESLDLETGEIYTVQPPYATMSLKPGIGADWFKQFKGDCFPKDFVTINGRKQQPPKFYLEQYEKEEPERVKAIKLKRLKEALEQTTTQQQREANETIKRKRSAQMPAKI